MKKLIKITLIMLIIMISNFAILANTVNAVENGQIHLYQTGTLNRILKYNGILIKTTHVVYDNNGNQYPAYCLNVELPGIESGEYEVTNQGTITDLGLWRVAINGYPYKSLEQLGVASEEEAYIATKQAIYCYLQNRGTEKYTAVDEAGQRTLNAMNIILANAQNSTETFENPQLNIEQSEKWEIDSIDNKYISKEYQIKTNKKIDKYKITLENEPQNAIITDMQNNIKEEFKSDEKFKILIPITSLKESGNFKINIQTQMETKPVFYGKAPNEQVQNYALTSYSIEDISSQLSQEYNQNETKIKIEKIYEETEEKLQGATIEILDSNKEILKKLVTNEEGIIELEQILPGKYYIREIEAPEGYELNNKLIEIEIELNEQKYIQIKNKKIVIEEPEPVIEEPKIEEPKPVEEPIKEIPKLPVTGM